MKQQTLQAPKPGYSVSFSALILLYNDPVAWHFPLIYILFLHPPLPCLSPPITPSLQKVLFVWAEQGWPRLAQTGSTVGGQGREAKGVSPCDRFIVCVCVGGGALTDENHDSNVSTGLLKGKTFEGVRCVPSYCLCVLMCIPWFPFQEKLTLKCLHRLMQM